MSIYSCNISNVSRGAGSSACATLSYITGSKVKSERENKTFNYGKGREDRVVTTETLLPDNAPAEFKDPAVLFNAIENFEKACDARPAKKIMVAFPVELELEQQREVIRQFCKQLTDQGYACTFAIHHDKEGKNPHAHVLVANRKINDKGEFDKTKCRKEFVLNEKGERIPIPEIDKETKEPVIDPKTKKPVQKRDKQGRLQWKRKNVQVNWLDTKHALQQLRDNWADICNTHLEPKDHISSKSHKARGIKYQSMVHVGWHDRAENLKLNEQIKADNANLSNTNREYSSVISELKPLLLEEKKEREGKLNKARKQTRNRTVSPTRWKNIQLQQERSNEERLIRNRRKERADAEKINQQKQQQVQYQQVSQQEIERYQQSQISQEPQRRSRGMSR